MMNRTSDLDTFMKGGTDALRSKITKELLAGTNVTVAGMTTQQIIALRQGFMALNNPDPATLDPEAILRKLRSKSSG